MKDTRTQRIFNRVARHLLKQNVQAIIRDSGTCQYRAVVDGKTLKCAVGCLIPDDVYKKSFEGWALTDHDVSDFPKPFRIFLRKKYSENDLEFLRELQIVHDNFKPERWKNKLIVLAKKAWLRFLYL